MMRKFIGLISAAIVGGCATAPLPPVAYIDAHSHIAQDMTPAEEIAEFRKAGLAGVVIMHPDLGQLSDIASANPGYVIPFASIARLPEMPGLRLGPGTAETMAEGVRNGKACGFGEIPTRIIPQTEPSDAKALLAPARREIYAAANATGSALNLHIDVATPDVIEAVAMIARENPRAKVVLAHGGWSATPETLRHLMDKYGNLYADLSVRLDPAKGLPSDPLPSGALPPGAGTVISILQTDGSLLPSWRGLIERHPDRFLFAMDITQRERPQHIALLMATARKALAPLGRATESAIAHKNFEKLVGDCRF